MAEQRDDTPPAPTAGTPSQTVRFDDSNLKSSYANVCNVSRTREDVVLVFGTNQIILSPFAAKRLGNLLANIIREYEARVGALNIDSPRSGESSG